MAKPDDGSGDGTQGKTDHVLRGRDKKEAFFRNVETGIQTFSATGADAAAGAKRTDYRLCKGDILRGTVQTLPPGFANNLHYHPAYEGFWMVLKGRVRFYGKDDTVIGEFGPMEGAFIPRNGRYWFAQVGDETAHLLQVRGDSRDGSNKRVDVETRHAGFGDKLVLDRS